MAFKCPVCKKQWDASLGVARHIFGVGDKKHRDWVDSKGENFKDLLVEQAMNPGNASYQKVADLVEKNQD
jgi:hypothetical protein